MASDNQLKPQMGKRSKAGLHHLTGMEDDQPLDPASEASWIDVIHKMDEIYTELVESQIELEQKHEELNAAYKSLRNAQQRLIHSEKMAALGRLVAGVAHELNNPISFVYGNMHALKRYGENLTIYLQAVQEKALSPELEQLHTELDIARIEADIVPLVDGTMEGAERVRDIVQELRRFSGKQSPTPITFKLRPMLETATSWVLRGVKQAPIVNIECPPTLSMTGSRGNVHQILINLIQNAVDALDGHQNPQISLKAKLDSRHVLVDVIDNGGGIAPHVIDQIFEPFYTTKPVGRGTGLGLYISYNMAAEMGGSLSVRKRRKDGTVFQLKLPAEGRDVEGILSDG